MRTIVSVAMLTTLAALAMLRDSSQRSSSACSRNGPRSSNPSLSATQSGMFPYILEKR